MMNRDDISASTSKALIEKLGPQDGLAALPFLSAQATAIINGQRTHVITQHYADCIFVIVTQVGKIGALTRVTTHKRPTLPPMMDDDDLLDDDFDSRNVSARYRQRDNNGVKAQVEETIDISDTTTSQTLFGTVPAGHETLYDFYKQQISSLIQEDLNAAGGRNDGLGSKSVLVSLSLKLPPSSNEDDEEEYFAEVAIEEKDRYEAILDLVRQARTW